MCTAASDTKSPSVTCGGPWLNYRNASDSCLPFSNFRVAGFLLAASAPQLAMRLSRHPEAGWTRAAWCRAWGFLRGRLIVLNRRAVSNNRRRRCDQKSGLSAVGIGSMLGCKPEPRNRGAWKKSRLKAVLQTSWDRVCLEYRLQPAFADTSLNLEREPPEGGTPNKLWTRPLTYPA